MIPGLFIIAPNLIIVESTKTEKKKTANFIPFCNITGCVGVSESFEGEHGVTLKYKEGKDEASIVCLMDEKTAKYVRGIVIKLMAQQYRNVEILPETVRVKRCVCVEEVEEEGFLKIKQGEILAALGMNIQGQNMGENVEGEKGVLKDGCTKPLSFSVGGISPPSPSEWDVIKENCEIVSLAKGETVVGKGDCAVRGFLHMLMKG